MVSRKCALCLIEPRCETRHQKHEEFSEKIETIQSQTSGISDYPLRRNFVDEALFSKCVEQMRIVRLEGFHLQSKRFGESWTLSLTLQVYLVLSCFRSTHGFCCLCWTHRFVCLHIKVLLLEHLKHFNILS